MCLLKIIIVPSQWIKKDKITNITIFK